MRYSWLLPALLASASFAADNMVYVLQTDKNALTITNTGGITDSQTLTLPAPPSGGKVKVLFSLPGYPQLGSESNCAADPCAVSLNTQLGRHLYKSWKVNGSDVQVGATSSWQELRLTAAPHFTAPFEAPMSVHGFTDFEKVLDVAIPGGSDVSNTAVFIETIGVMPGNFSILGNSGTEHILNSISIVGFTSAGGVGSEVCTATTFGRHGFTTGNEIQQSFFIATQGSASAGSPPSGSMNGVFTVASTPTARTYTIACPGLTAGDYNTGIGTVGQNAGKVVSKTNFYCGNDQWNGGMNAQLRVNCLLIPMGAGEFTAGATNALTFRFKGATPAFIQKYRQVHGVRVIDFNIIQRNRSCTVTQIVVTGANRVASCTAHGYADGDTVLLLNAPGPRWRFYGKHVITAHTNDTFTFTDANIEDGGTVGAGIYTTPNGTYVAPTSLETTNFPQPVITAYRCLIPKADFTAPAAPSTFTGFGGNASAGLTAFTTATLKNRNPFAPNNASLTTCSGCHTRNGMDLKKFGYEPLTIKIASMDRGLTETQANDIVEYILSLPYATSIKGRPWNPPYQPGPGLTTSTVEEWTWGRGLAWTLTFDNDMEEWFIPGGSYATWAYNSEVDNRELPRPFPEPFWTQWLPREHPADACAYFFGCTFSSMSASTIYEGQVTAFSVPKALSVGVNSSATTFTFATAAACTNNNYLVIGEGANREFVQVTAGCGTTSWTVVRARTINSVATTGHSHSAGEYPGNYTEYLAISPRDDPFFIIGVRGFGDLYVNSTPPGGNSTSGGGIINPSQYTIYGAAVSAWSVTKMFEIMAEYRLQDMDDIITRSTSGIPSANAGPQYTRGWQSSTVFNRPAHKNRWQGLITVGNVDEAFTAVHDAIESSAWYDLGQILTVTNRFTAGGPIDWNYTNALALMLSYFQPAFNMKMLWHPVQIQQSMGWPVPANMTLTSIDYGLTFSLRLEDKFVSQARVASDINQSALLLASIIPLFSTAQWQAYPVGVGWPLADPVNIPTAYVGSQPNLQSHIAYGLAIMSYYGANGTAMTTIKNWANAVWAATGHDFQTDIDVGPSCTYTTLDGGFNRVECSTFH